MREIQLRDAKASLSAVVDEAVQGKPAIITRHGKPQAVIVSYEEWQRLSHVPSFGHLLMAAPLAPDDLPSRDLYSLARHRFLIARVSRRHQRYLGWGALADRQRPGLVEWMDRHSADLFLSAVTVAEIEDGIAKARREGAARKGAEFGSLVGSRAAPLWRSVLAFDTPTARIAGALSDRARGQGQAPGFADIVIAATAQHHDLTILSRNLKHFEPLGVPVLDPLRGAASVVKAALRLTSSKSTRTGCKPRGRRIDHCATSADPDNRYGQIWFG